MSGDPDVDVRRPDVRRDLASGVTVRGSGRATQRSGSGFGSEVDDREGGSHRGTRGLLHQELGDVRRLLGLCGLATQLALQLQDARSRAVQLLELQRLADYFFELGIDHGKGSPSW